MKSEFLNGERRAARKLPADQKNERHDCHRHYQREPLERFVAKARRRRHFVSRRPLDRGHGSDYGHIRLTAFLSGTRESLVLYLVDAFQHAITQIIWKRRVIEISRHLLTLGVRPFQELDQLLAFGRVCLLLVNEQPGRARDRIRVLARSVRHRKTEVIWNVSSGQRGGD